MSPADAYARLLDSGPFDDPDIVSYPTRWYFGTDGVLERCPWRGVIPQRFPDFVAPGPVRFGAVVSA